MVGAHERAIVETGGFWLHREFFWKVYVVLDFIWECVPRLDGSDLRSTEDTEVSLKRKALRGVRLPNGDF